jgi:hypothetical protein
LFKFHKANYYPDSSILEVYRYYHSVTADTALYLPKREPIFHSFFPASDTIIKIKTYVSPIAQRTYCTWKVRSLNFDIFFSGRTPDQYTVISDPADTTYTFVINY